MSVLSTTVTRRRGTVVASVFLAATALLLCPANAERLPLKLYQTGDGLSNNWAIAIDVDSKGFLWFSTREGLSRFDGSTFTRYGRKEGLMETAIISLTETNEGNYLVATNSGSLYLFRSVVEAGTAGPFVRFPLVVDSIEYGPTSSPESICKDSQGNLWIGTGDGLVRIGSGDGVLMHIAVHDPAHPQEALPVQVICDDHSGSLWLGTPRGIIRFAILGGKSYLYRLQKKGTLHRISSILYDTAGRLWIGDGKSGLYIVRPEPLDAVDAFHRWKVVKGKMSLRGSALLPATEGEVHHYTSTAGLSLNTISAICATNDGRIWIGTTAGVTMFETGRFHTYTVKNGLCSDNVQSLAGDGQDNLWIGTIQGVQKLSLQGMTSYDELDGIPKGVVHALYNAQSEQIYAVVGDWNIAEFASGHFLTVRPHVPANSEHGWFSQVGFLDRSGEWWTVSNEAFCRYGKVKDFRALDRRNPVSVYTRVGDFRKGFFRMYDDKRGGLWIGTRAMLPEITGLFRLDRKNGRFQFYGSKDGLPEQLSMSAFCEDSSGNVWMGFYQGGIARYSDGKFRFWSPADGAPRTMITALHTDRSGKVWIGSNEQGASMVRDPGGDSLDCVSYTMKEGLSTDNVRCLAEDRWGRMYFGTIRGIDRLNPSTGLITHFDGAEGLANEWVVSALQDAAGNMWFGTMDGLSRLTPYAEHPINHPPIYLRTIRVGGITYVRSGMGERNIGGLELGASQNNLEIDFFSIGYKGPIRYQYRLNGSGGSWSHPIYERTINYAGLSSGDYAFEVRAINPEGLTSDVPAVFRFRLLAPFWRQWWFLLLSFAAVASLLYSLFRYRIRRAVELEHLRVRIASDLHDEVGSALTQIAVHSEIIQRADKPERVLSSSQTIGTVSREVIRTLADIVWSIDARHDTFGQLTGRMKSFALDILPPKNIEVLFDIEGISPEKQIPVNLRENLYLIYKEALTNIAKHSSASRVNVSFRETDGKLRLDIRDNGKGIDFEREDGGHGLKNMKLRAERIDGILTFQNLEGFRITLTTKAP